MTRDVPTRPSARPSPAMSTREEAEALCALLEETMEALIGLLQSEKELLSAAHYREAAMLGEEKTALVGRFAALMARVGAEARTLDRLAPAHLRQVARQQDRLIEAVRDNMPVVERARDLSVRLLKGVAEVAERLQSGPHTYGGDARTDAPAAKPAQLSLDRSA
jgi:hypothetical protein